MEKLALEISDIIANQLNYNEDKKDVITYGLTALFQLLTIGTISSILGILFNILYESLAVFICVGLIKKSTGGAHSDSINICTFMSISLIFLFAYLSANLQRIHISLLLNMGVMAVIFLIAVITFHKYVPVDSPNKPITNPRKIRKLRIQSFIKLALFLILAFTFGYLGLQCPRLKSISYSIQFAVVWQTFILTKKGEGFTKILDSLFLKKGS